MCRTRIKIKIKKKKHNLDILKHLYSKKKEEKGKKKDTILIQKESFLNIQEQMKFD